MNEYNFTREELIRLFDGATLQTQHMVFAILKIDHDANSDNRQFDKYLGKPKSTVNGVPLYEMAELMPEYDSRFDEAVKIALETGEVSVSMLQRRMRVGYARAGRIVDEMQRRGIVLASNRAESYKVIVGKDEYKEGYFTLNEES